MTVDGTCLVAGVGVLESRMIHEASTDAEFGELSRVVELLVSAGDSEEEK